MPAEKNRTILMVAYGSLLSGYGILAERRGGGSKLIARDAFPVTLANARRGLAKPSSHGHYLAMDLEPLAIGQPLVARGGAAVDGIGVLGLEFDREWAPKIARREEYSPEKFCELIALADHAGQPLGEYLFALAERTRFDLLAYRTALRELVGYTSPGYVFHPIPFHDGRVGVAAIGSGFEGSGDPAVRSKRNECGMERLLSLPEALAVNRPNLQPEYDGQVGYFVECILGGVHGLGVADLVAGLDPSSPLGLEVKRRLAAAVVDECARFCSATSMDEARYHTAFGGLAEPRLQPFFAAVPA
ncbi:MAG TPA: hypothetical protein VKS22_01410 [Candidatus Binataceae bacterium]|nr:hypothetical protein [Candidatus Binataceae bacterium]